ncbi:hypothetical protein RB195_012402 [Necator americanus]|uniref:Uncharacterized protein n=1 Tax=Necator americanus TaxID=51031 RepID=A0ABR1D840_NECAM
MWESGCGVHMERYATTQNFTTARTSDGENFLPCLSDVLVVPLSSKYMTTVPSCPPSKKIFFCGQEETSVGGERTKFETLESAGNGFRFVTPALDSNPNWNKTTLISKFGW